ncbi:dipeptidase PepV [Italian clover phyllody phytoplasma]|uniref:dipeptidase PepV n=1 Tax=Italian clover phyllody phytoplasma TaxID=1196420 RepID=UPI0002E4EFE7|nr:dipeptidase PepV [Italian clover phyllody phytoplasma]
MFDFKKEVLKREDIIVKTLQDLLRIESELETFKPENKGAPFGQKLKEALDFMLNLGQKDGFKTLNVDGYAGHIEYGNQTDWIGIIGHLDVVPAGNHWSYPPYEAKIVDGKIYARGSQDNKGPVIASYFALSILKELNIPLKKRVKFILGLDEECEWYCVDHYFEKHPEIPVAGFVPDSYFPLVYAEKGLVVLSLETESTDPRIISMQGGSKVNVVPDLAQAVLVYESHYEALFQQYIQKNDINATFTRQNDKITIEVKGSAFHGSAPKQGINANDALIKILQALNIENNFFNFLNNYVVDSSDGQKMGIQHLDAETEHLTLFSGVFTYDNNKASFYLDLRYPKGIKYEDIMTQINQKAKENNIKVHVVFHKDLFYQSPKSPLSQTLMKAYQKHANDLVSQPLTRGGGSFVRTVPNLVAFGPIFPKENALFHQKDENISIQTLMKLTMIYTEALYELTAQ